MGLSASQGRMLSLTSRLSDLEYRAQNVQNQKIRLADRSEAISKNYLDALNAKKLTAYNPETSSQVDASLTSIYGLNSVSGKKRVIVDSEGKTIVPGSYLDANGNLTKSIGAVQETTKKVTKEVDDPEHPGQKKLVTVDEPDEHRYVAPKGYKACPQGKESDTEYMYEQLACGNWFIVEYDEEGGAQGTGSWDKISFNSGDAQLMVKTDDFEIARAEAEYETAMNEIQNKDKRFDLELQTIDTEHKAIQTEMDSVNKVMDKNIERTFKIFG